MRLDAAAHPNKIESIIVRGWDLDPIFNLRLSMFLEQLQRLDGLQHLVLALPCGGVSVMLLGRLTRLRSLRMCADVSHSSEVSCQVALCSVVVAFHLRCCDFPRWESICKTAACPHLSKQCCTPSGWKHAHARESSQDGSSLRRCL